MSKGIFKLKSKFAPAGDQPKAIAALVEGIKKGFRHQTLLGVTGSGKTFTVANVINAVQKPTLVIAHNKTLAAQLAQEYREFFPDNAVHYFVSYYDYYQPEAYMPVTDTYIEKEAMINEEIERLRHASTQALLTRKDVIIVASVSCIYGLGSPTEYERVNIKIENGMQISRGDFLRKLIGIHFERTNADLSPGQFRALGNAIEIMPVNERAVYRIAVENGTIENISVIDAISRAHLRDEKVFFLFPAKHFITDDEQVKVALLSIKSELKERLKELERDKKPLEAERLKRRTNYDLALIREVGYCNGIENYSRHFSGKLPGEPPDTLLSYFPRLADGSPDFLTVIDESHVTVPQIGGMFAGDASRKQSLIDFGFRLPSARDNRPLKFNEFEERVGQVLYTSATPGAYELKKSCGIVAHSTNSERHGCAVVEQVIRPTGLIDPEVFIRPIRDMSYSSFPKGGAESARRRISKSLPLADSGSPFNKGRIQKQKSTPYQGQIFDFIAEAQKVIKGGGRVIATTLTKKMAEDLSVFLKEKNVKAEYLHSDIKTIERIEILTRFRKGEFDCVVGVNLLREGLDLPEVELIGILDADNEGFLRSETSLVQIIGRAARNVKGRVILYADSVTGSMERAIGETNRRRALQVAYNKNHGITPTTIYKAIRDITEELDLHKKAVKALVALDMGGSPEHRAKIIKEKERQMNAAVKILDFETAALLRDEIAALQKIESKNG